MFHRIATTNIDFTAVLLRISTLRSQVNIPLFVHGLILFRRVWYTLRKINMEPEKHWVVEENSLPKVHAIRFHASFRECNIYIYLVNYKCALF